MRQFKQETTQASATSLNLALRIQVDKATKEVESLKTRLGKYEDVEVKTIITGIGKFEEDMKTNITEHTSSH